MATLGKPFCLCPISSDGKDIYLSSARDLGCVAFTHKGRCVEICKVDDQKIIQSWSFKRGTNILGPVIFNHLDQTYSAVTHNKEIRTWKEDLQNLDKAKKHSTSKPVNRLFNIPGFSPAILFDNGCVVSLGHGKEGNSDNVHLKDSEIIWSGSVTDEDCVAVCFLSKNQSCDLTAHFSRLSGQNLWSTKSIPIDLTEKEFTCCCLSYSNSPHLFLLSSSGNLYGINESDGRTNLYHTLPGIQNGATATALAESHIAVAGVSKGQQIGLGIFDIQFGSMLEWKPFPENISSFSQLFAIESHLFVGCGSAIYGYEVTCAPCTLGSVLGTLVDNDQPTKGNNCQPLSLSWIVGDPQVVQKSTRDVLALFTKLNNPSMTPTLIEFKNVFEKLMTYLKKLDYQQFWTSEHMANLIRRITAEKKFWPTHEMIKVIQNGFVPPSVISEFFEALIGHNDVVLLHASMTNFPHIPETQLVQTLNYYLRCEESDFSDVCDDTIEELEIKQPDTDSPVTCPFAIAKTLFINAVLAHPYNDVFLLQRLRTVPFESVLVLLQYLYYLFTNLKTVEKSRSNYPSLPQIVDWMCLLVDAHATQLIISPDARPLMVNLHQLVLEQMKFYDALISLEAVFCQLKEQRTPTSKKAMGTYCIEVLHIK